MTQFYVTSWRWHGSNEGFRSSGGYIPDGFQDVAEWSAIDLASPPAPGADGEHGVVLVATPERLAAGPPDFVTDNANDRANSVRNVLNRRLPTTTLRPNQTLGEHLAQWMVEEERVPPLRPSAKRKQYEIMLAGETLWSMPAVSGAATYDETWPVNVNPWGTANQQLLTDQDYDWLHTWHNQSGYIDNGAFKIDLETGYGEYIMQTTLTVDHWCSVHIASHSTSTFSYPLIVRYIFINGDWQGYVSWITSANNYSIRKVPARTILASVAGATFPADAYMEADGSAISATLGALSLNTTDSSYTDLHTGFGYDRFQGVLQGPFSSGDVGDVVEPVVAVSPPVGLSFV